MEENADRWGVVDFLCADWTPMNFFNAGNCRILNDAEDGELDIKSVFVLDTEEEDNLVWCC